MSPTSIAFSIFLPVVLVIQWAMPRRAAAQNGVLLVATYVFYSSWSPKWLERLHWTGIDSGAVADSLRGCCYLVHSDPHAGIHRKRPAP